MLMYEQPFQVGLVLVKRVPSSAARYRAVHLHYWHGYLCLRKIPTKWITKFGKLIEVRSAKELEAERLAYRAQMQVAPTIRLAYYEVIDAGTV